MAKAAEQRDWLARAARGDARDLPELLETITENVTVKQACARLGALSSFTDNTLVAARIRSAVGSQQSARMSSRDESLPRSDGTAEGPRNEGSSGGYADS